MKNSSRFSSGMLIFSLSLLIGCSTTQDKVHQFNPVPVAKVGSSELSPAKEYSASELLRAADKEWRQANEAQDKGDHKAALRHYSQMLAYLSDADLNPAVFEGLRDEFERILDSNIETANLFAREHTEFDKETGRAKTSDIFAGTVVTQARVQTEIDEIVERYPKNFQAGLDRSWNYRATIEQEFAKAGLPKDLVWLAMVESQFHPNVVSRAGAVGMWQFMRATGKRYGLRIDSYVDERRDWLKSTRAAAAYLSDLYEYHNGAWPLAIASYNMGEGGISRMVAMNGGERDIWKLISNPPASDHMPQETKKFYPKLAASWIVATSPKSFGFRENPTAPENVVTVPVQGSYSLAALERGAGLPGGTLKRLNPHLIKEVTPPGGDYGVVVPAEASSQFTAALASVSKESRKSVNSLDGRTFHIVKRGDTLSKIAEKYGVDQNKIASANKVRFAHRIPVGKKLLIPTGTSEDTVEPEKPSTKKQDEAPREVAKPKASAKLAKYTVKKGDTLFEIAQMHQVSLESLQQWNGLDRHARIRVNQELVVSESAAPEASKSEAPQDAPKPDTYVVQGGDTLAKIANAHDMSLDALLALNEIDKDDVLHANDKLLVAKSTASAPPVKEKQEASKPDTYVVQSGDTLAKIANAHDMSLDALIALNEIDKNDVLHANDKLLVAKSTASAPPASKEIQEAPKEQDDAPSAVLAVSSTHKVASGETLSGIAAKYDMTLSDLRALNSLEKDDVLKSGQTLKVQGAAPTEEAPIQLAVSKPSAKEDKAVGVATHTVEKNETLSEIALKYKAKVSQLVAWNNLGDRARITIGQKLIVSAPTADTSPASSGGDGNKTVHRVASGQSPTSIAKRYGVKVNDLFDWNKWEKDHVLHIDDEVIIFTK